MQTYRLTNEPGGRGLSCTPAGLSLAGVPLLEKTEAGFLPRPAPEITALIKAAHGAQGDATRLASSLGGIARALNGGDLARAGIAAVLTRTPVLSREAAARLAHAEEILIKYNRDEPRDWHGRWTTGEAAAPASIVAPGGERAAGRRVDLIGQRASNPEPAVTERYASLTPVAFVSPDDEADDDDSREPTSLEQAFERETTPWVRSILPSRSFSLATG